MSKFKDFIGVDISKDVFDVMDSYENHYQFYNDLTGFKEFGKILSTRSHYVMEVTGCYYQSLATWLYSKEIAVSVAIWFAIVAKGLLRKSSVILDFPFSKLL